MFKHFERVARDNCLDHSAGIVNMPQSCSSPRSSEIKTWLQFNAVKGMCVECGAVCLGPTSLFSQVSPAVSHLHHWFSDLRFYVGHQVATRRSTIFFFL